MKKSVNLEDVMEQFEPYVRCKKRSDVEKYFRTVVDFDSDERRVMIVMGRWRDNEWCTGIYIRAYDIESKEYILALPTSICSYHKTAVAALEAGLGTAVKPSGGGFIAYDRENLVVYGSSGSYGPAGNNRVAEIIESISCLRVRYS